MPRIVNLQPHHNCVLGHGDCLQTADGCMYDIDFDAVRGNGRRFQLRARVNPVDETAESGHNTDTEETQSPALAG